jgi:hypothetical protein
MDDECWAKQQGNQDWNGMDKNQIKDREQQKWKGNWANKLKWTNISEGLKAETEKVKQWRYD